jgi:hypothetical protein
MHFRAREYVARRVKKPLPTTNPSGASSKYRNGGATIPKIKMPAATMPRVVLFML